MSCNSIKKENDGKDKETYATVKIFRAMKNVMWKGELDNSINLGTIQEKRGLYGLGPEIYLKQTYFMFQKAQ